MNRFGRIAWTPETLARSLELATLLGLCPATNDNAKRRPPSRLKGNPNA
jgi:hypothetical protein